MALEAHARMLGTKAQLMQTLLANVVPVTLADLADKPAVRTLVINTFALPGHKCFAQGNKYQSWLLFIAPGAGEACLTFGHRQGMNSFQDG